MCEGEREGEQNKTTIHVYGNNKCLFDDYLLSIITWNRKYKYLRKQRNIKQWLKNKQEGYDGRKSLTWDIWCNSRNIFSRQLYVHLGIQIGMIYGLLFARIPSKHFSSIWTNKYTLLLHSSLHETLPKFYQHWSDKWLKCTQYSNLFWLTESYFVWHVRWSYRFQEDCIHNLKHNETCLYRLTMGKAKSGVFWQTTLLFGIYIANDLTEDQHDDRSKHVVFIRRWSFMQVKVYAASSI